MFGQPGFAVLVALTGLLAFNWPFPELARAMGVFSLFVYFFAAWAGAIVLALLISRAVADPAAGKDNDDA